MRKLCFIFFAGILCLIRTAAAQVLDTICAGYSQAYYEVDHHPGSLYFWSVEGGQIIAGNQTNMITVNWGNKPGLYRVYVREQNSSGCFGEPVSGYVLLKGTNFRTEYPASACKSDSVTITASGAMRYQWSTGSSDSSIRILLNRDTTLLVVVSDTSCGMHTDTLPVSIKAVDKPEAGFVSDADEYFKDRPVSFVYSGKRSDNVSWRVEKSNLSLNNKHNLNVRFIDTGDAFIQLFSVNEFGCRDSITRLINVKDEQLYFPNAFTPNGDGLNELFKPGGTGIRSYRLRVFNSWGDLVFESTETREGWDGKVDGHHAPTGTYVYQCDAIGNSGKTHAFNGNITLLR